MKSYPYLKWAKKLILTIVPTRVSFRTELDRNYNELEFRNIDYVKWKFFYDFDVIKTKLLLWLANIM